MNNFWNNFFQAFNSSKCKTTLMIVSIIISMAFALDQVFGSCSADLAKGFFAVMAFWWGSYSKSKDNK